MEPERVSFVLARKEAVSFFFLVFLDKFMRINWRDEKIYKGTAKSTYSLLFASRLLRRSSSSVTPFDCSHSPFSISNAFRRSSSSRICSSRAWRGTKKKGNWFFAHRNGTSEIYCPDCNISKKVNKQSAYIFLLFCFLTCNC